MTPTFADPFAKYINTFLREFDKVMDRHSIRVALDVGSRDAAVAIALEEHCPAASVYAFECNPPAVEQCRENIEGHAHITLVDKAVSDVGGPTDFWAIDAEKSASARWPEGNIGASSLFIANPAYPHERYYQNRIEVEAVTLERWAADSGVDAVDLLWMDLQGAELKALKGMGDLLETVRMVYTEVLYQEIYFGQAFADEIDQYLVSHGFRLHTKLNSSSWFGDALYIREGEG